ncbi:MAG: cytochrome c [Chloroflexi bacterium]|nr:cytochrome c [Chloroflexota bacterium]
MRQTFVFFFRFFATAKATVKQHLFLVSLALILGLGAVACTQESSQREKDLENEVASLKQENALLREIAGPPPASLDNLYPPKAPAPLFLLQMFAMATPAEGIMADLQQGDVANAQASYERFKAEYTKASKMVPEWKDKFPMEPITALGEALKTGDQAKIGQAFGAVGQVCGSCHLANQNNVRFKYHWPDFGQVKVSNPVIGQSQGLLDFMFSLSGAFGGIGNDLQQGQLDNARQNFQAFNAQFKALGEACSACHTTPRAYFVDATVQALIDRLGAELNKPSPDLKTLGDLSGAIGNESCGKCHLVHQPAAFAQDRWKR